MSKCRLVDCLYALWCCWKDSVAKKQQLKFLAAFEREEILFPGETQNCFLSPRPPQHCQQQQFAMSHPLQPRPAGGNEGEFYIWTRNIPKIAKVVKNENDKKNLLQGHPHWQWKQKGCRVWLWWSVKTRWRCGEVNSKNPHHHAKKNIICPPICQSLYQQFSAL